MQKKRLLSRSRDPVQLSNTIPMTLPDERYRAVKSAALFLSRLAGGEYPRVPKAVRVEARSILRHYPNNWDMSCAAEAAPNLFQEHMEDVHRFIAAGVLAAEQQDRTET